MKANIRLLRPIVELAAFAVLCAAPLLAQDTQYRVTGQLIPAPPCLAMSGIGRGGAPPCTAFTHREWLTDITHWRTERRIRIGYDGSRYDIPALKWAESSFMKLKMMVHDRNF